MVAAPPGQCGAPKCDTVLSRPAVVPLALVLAAVKCDGAIAHGAARVGEREHVDAALELDAHVGERAGRGGAHARGAPARRHAKLLKDAVMLTVAVAQEVL